MIKKMAYRFFLPHVLVLFSTVFASLTILIIVRRRLQILGGKIFFILFLAVTEWTLCAAFEAAATDPGAKIFWSKLEYLGLCTAPVMMLLFVLEYTHQTLIFPSLTRRLLWVLPALTLILAWSNEWHGWIWSGFSPGSAELNALIYHHGPVFWIYSIYAFIILLAVIFILLRAYFGSTQIYRGQLLVMILANLISLLGGILYATNLNPLPGVDLSIIGTSFSSWLFALSLFRLQFLDLVPVARGTVIEQIQVGILVVDVYHRLVDINPAGRVLLQQKFSPANDSTIFSLLPEGGKQLFQQAIQELPDDEKGGPQEWTAEFYFDAGQTLFYEMKISNLYNGPQNLIGRLVLLRDITRRKQAEIQLQEMNRSLQEQLAEITLLKDQLRDQAIHDSLTGLYNRRFLDGALSALLSHAQRDHTLLNLLMIDIDHFKLVNDTYGHACGDQVLKTIAELLRHETRQADVTCRYGGEEFLIVLPRTPVAIAEKRAEKIRLRCAELLFRAGQAEFHVTISIGIATFPLHASEVYALVECSDQALYLAKSRGRNQVAVYTPGPLTPA